MGRREKTSALLGSLVVTTALAGCSKPINTDEELRKKYEAPNTIVYGLDDWMAETFTVYTTITGEIIETKCPEDASGVVNYIFVIKPDDNNSKNFSINVDLPTYFQYNSGDKVTVTLKVIRLKDTEESIDYDSYIDHSKKTEKETGEEVEK